MNDKTEQALTDALIDQIESAARASFRRAVRYGLVEIKAPAVEFFFERAAKGVPS